MLERLRTHREIKSPQTTARYLADYMAASERARRTIIRACKYQPITRVIQHNDAKLAVSRSLWDAEVGPAFLNEESRRLRERLADDDFDREVNEHNADYIDRFAKVYPGLSLPDAELSPVGEDVSVNINGVKVNLGLHARLKRITRTNKVRVGAAALRYAKGKSLSREVGLWQSAFMFGYLAQEEAQDGADAEQKLCLTIDAYKGVAIPAPTNSLSRFRNMEAACATIAERWDNIEPPKGAVL